MVSSLSPVEVQLIAQFLRPNEIVALSHGNRRLHSDLNSRFTFRNVGHFTLDRDNREGLTDRSFVKYIDLLSVSGELVDFDMLPKEVKNATKALNLKLPSDQSIGTESINALKRVIESYRSLNDLELQLEQWSFDIIVPTLISSTLQELYLANCPVSDITPLTDSMLQAPMRATSAVSASSSTRLEGGIGAHLRALSLQWCTLSPESLSSIFRMLATNRTLKSLKLSGNVISSTEVRSLADALRVNTTLENLHIGYCRIGDGVIEIAEALYAASSSPPTPHSASSQSDERSGSALSIINLTGNSISSRGAEALSKVYALSGTQSRISCIRLAYNLIGTDGAAAIAKALMTAGSNSLITEIDLTDNGIGPEGISFFCYAITSLDYNCRITSLIFGRNAYDNRVAEALRKAADKNRSIQHLSLSGGPWPQDRDNTDAMVRALVINRTLTGLRLKHIDLRSVSVSIWEMLKTNTSLTSLELSESKIDDVSFLGDALKSNRTLQTLSLDGCKIQDNGISAIAEALSQNDTLTSLDLSINYLTENGILAILAVLDSDRSISRLQWLDLGSNTFTVNTKTALLEVLRPGRLIGSLRYLRLISSLLGDIVPDLSRIQTLFGKRCTIRY